MTALESMIASKLGFVCFIPAVMCSIFTCRAVCNSLLLLICEWVCIWPRVFRRPVTITRQGWRQQQNKKKKSRTEQRCSPLATISSRLQPLKRVAAELGASMRWLDGLLPIKWAVGSNGVNDTSFLKSVLPTRARGWKIQNLVTFRRVENRCSRFTTLSRNCPIQKQSERSSVQWSCIPQYLANTAWTFGWQWSYTLDQVLGQPRCVKPVLRSFSLWTSRTPQNLTYVGGQLKEWSCSGSAAGIGK